MNSFDNSASNRIEDWRAKILRDEIPTGNRLGYVAVRSLDVLKCALHEGFSSQNLQCALKALENERNVAMKGDTHRNAMKHSIIYGLADSIHVFMKEFVQSISMKEEGLDEIPIEGMVAPKEEEFMEEKESEIIQPVKTSFLPVPPLFEQETSLKLFSSDSPVVAAYDIPLQNDYAKTSMASTSYHPYSNLTDQQTIRPFRRSSVKIDANETIVVSQETKLVCPICQHTSTKATGLQSHLRRIHDGMTMNELGIGLLCECGKMFNAFYALFKHNQRGCGGTLTMFSRKTGEANIDGSPF